MATVGQVLTSVMHPLQYESENLTRLGDLGAYNERLRNTCAIICLMQVLMQPVDVPTAAEMLGISQARIRKLIENHHLPAFKIGGRWAIPHGNLAARLNMRFPPSRPYSPQRAWQAINATDVDVLDGVKYQQRGRVTRWYRGSGVPYEMVYELGGMLSGVAASTEWLERVAAHHDIGIPKLKLEHDFYIPCAKYSDLVGLSGWYLSTEGTTVIRFVEDEVWESAVSEAEPSVEYQGLMLAPLAAVSLDLMTCSGSRNRDAALAIMQHKQQILNAA